MSAHKSLEVTGLVEEMARLEHLLLDNPLMERELHQIIDEALREVRKGMVSDAGSAMSSDPRGAKRAVRRSVYRRILGGQVNILKKRKAGRMGGLPDANAHQWWRRRGYKTGQMARYTGSDRGFVLRFVNDEKKIARKSPTMDAHPMYRKSIEERPEFHDRSKGERFKSSILGYRGRMGNKGTRFFSNSEGRMISSLPELEKKISELIEREFNK